MKKQKIVPPTNKVEDPPVPKYVVLTTSVISPGVMYDIVVDPFWTAKLFVSLDEAIRYADSKKGSKLFGLNPEYEFQVCTTAWPKSGLYENFGV